MHYYKTIIISNTFDYNNHIVFISTYTKIGTPQKRHCEFVALAFSNRASHFLPLSCKQAINIQGKKY